MRTRSGAALAGAVTLALLASCSDTEGEFQRKAEEVIVDQLRVDYALEGEVDCDAPPSVDVGTAFACSARGADGRRYDYIAEITGARELRVRPSLVERDFGALAERAVAAEIRKDLGLESEVACDPPLDADVGTTFVCTAEASDDTRYSFEAEITGDETLDVRLVP